LPNCNSQFQLIIKLCLTNKQITELTNKLNYGRVDKSGAYLKKRRVRKLQTHNVLVVGLGGGIFAAEFFG
jgi:hypothetical protein